MGHLPIDYEKLDSELIRLSGTLRFRLFAARSFPAAAFTGLRIDRLDRKLCITSVPGGWRTQNPFRTVYWAVQGMAAELATGAAPFAISRSMSEKLRMFVIGVESSFTKRAKGRISFTCDELDKVCEAVERSIASGESVNLDLRSIGTDSSGDVVSEWVFKWNFRVMSR
ncbi:MAG: DUF4442 domain-containing protein [Candidatus Thalassarchaeaceae archaeon]|nr:DUF4442 domain-containing protein [Candidatus Thalassarchaeaceae archaeon]